jgi:hypothetical protein
MAYAKLLALMDTIKILELVLVLHVISFAQLARDLPLHVALARLLHFIIITRVLVAAQQITFLLMEFA